MKMRSFFLGLLAVPLLLGLNVESRATVANPSLGGAIVDASGVTDVRWVCGPWRCAFIPRYREPVVVYPHMRRWVRPPNLHCFYEHRLFRWVLVCP